MLQFYSNIFILIFVFVNTAQSRPDEEKLVRRTLENGLAIRTLQNGLEIRTLQTSI